MPLKYLRFLVRLFSGQPIIVAVAIMPKFYSAARILVGRGAASCEMGGGDWAVSGRMEGLGWGGEGWSTRFARRRVMGLGER